MHVLPYCIENIKTNRICLHFSGIYKEVVINRESSRWAGSAPQDDNLMDVLQLLVALMSEHPGSMIQAFDQRNGIR